MAIDEGLAQRVREMLSVATVDERRMFGGLAFLTRGHMFIGIAKQALMVRVGPAAYDQALAQPHVREMDFTGRPMRGYVFVDARGYQADADLKHWVTLALAFNATLPAK
jgi:TfoX/Sxy family transcriptional regulator of competence genes